MIKNATPVYSKAMLNLNGRQDPSRKSHLAYGMLMVLLSAQAQAQAKTAKR